jgi:hypothetical protein
VGQDADLAELSGNGTDIGLELFRSSGLATRLTLLRFGSDGGYMHPRPRAEFGGTLASNLMLCRFASMLAVSFMGIIILD